MKILQFIVQIVGIVWIGLTSCSEAPTQSSSAPASGMEEGKELMQVYCQSCHQLPRVNSLNTLTWEKYVLVRMSAYMGVFHDSKQYHDKLPTSWLEPGIGGSRVLNAQVYPEQELVSRTQWEAISNYILSNSPQQISGAGLAGPLAASLPLFNARPLLAHGTYQPIVTGVAIDPFRQLIYAGYRDQALVAVRPDGGIQQTITGYIAPVQILPQADQITVVDIGNMVGSDAPMGQWQRGSSLPIPNKQTTPAQQGLQRPTHISYGDLDQDGDEDIVLCEFGNQLGQLSWWEQQPGNNYSQHILKAEDGAIRSVIADLNQDGLQDIVVLMANADEGVDLYLNEGNGTFQAKRVLRFDPTWGSVDMEVRDMDKDGDLDIICANGDNADYPAILKSYHGIRIYENRGTLHFEEHSFLPLDGAYGIRVRDFDEDGDMDIAAVSFYPDYLQFPNSAFTYMNNQGDGQFTLHTFSEVVKARWMVLDAGDADGDGDIDLILGGYDIKTSEVPVSVVQAWQQADAPLMYLENTLR